MVEGKLSELIEFNKQQLIERKVWVHPKTGKPFQRTMKINPEHMREIGKIGFKSTMNKLSTMMRDENANPDEVEKLARWLARKVKSTTDTYRAQWWRAYRKELQNGDNKQASKVASAFISELSGHVKKEEGEDISLKEKLKVLDNLLLGNKIREFSDWIEKQKPGLVPKKIIETVHRGGKTFTRRRTVYVKPEEPKFELKKEDIEQFKDIVKHINLQGYTHLDLNAIYNNNIRPMYNRILGELDTLKLEAETRTVKSAIFVDMLLLIGAHTSANKKKDFIETLKNIGRRFPVNPASVDAIINNSRKIEEAERLYLFKRKIIDAVFKEQKFISLFRGCNGKTIKKGQYKIGDFVKVDTKMGFSRMTLQKETAEDFARERGAGGYVIEIKVPIDRIYYIDGMFGASDYGYENEMICDVDGLEAEIIDVGE